jgi:uncharacterized protein (TIGR02231 family)
MKKIFFLAGLFTCLLSHAQDTAKANATLLAATVYFGYGAELTHEAKVNVNSGIKQIVISQLSTLIDQNSLQINVPEDVALLSQKFSVYSPAVAVIINPLVKKWQDSIVIVQKDISKNDNLIEIETAILDKTGKLIELTIDRSDTKAINAEDALKLINFYTAKIEKSKTTVYNLIQLKNQLTEQIAKFQVKINEAMSKPANAPKSYGQLTLQVLCNTKGEIPVSFSYFTNNAGWTPLYDVRVNSKTNEIKLVYKASVTQTTGIDWKKTKITLSTGNPTWGGVPPVLSPWNLQLYVPNLYNTLEGKVPGLRVDDNKLAEVVVTSAYGAKKVAKSLVYNTQNVEPSNLQRYTTLTESQLNTNFEIALPYDIESDGQLHNVNIKEEKISAILKNYAVPKLDKDAYLLAEISEWESLDLLPGNANIIMDNTYLGKSFIEANSTDDTLKLSLGKDRRLSIKRQPVKDFTSTKTSGNNTKQIFTYEITVKNNKLTEVDLSIKDQYPISMVKEIEIKLDDFGGATVEEELGILGWNIKLKPGESQKLRFSYTVKYAKDKKIIGL